MVFTQSNTAGEVVAQVAVRYTCVASGASIGLMLVAAALEVI